ncbi:MAG: tyrosine-type recombinase/integrase [bacterium]
MRFGRLRDYDPKMKAYPEPEEIGAMEKEASNMRDELLIRVLFHLGCRVTEALSLTVEDVDFDHGTVTIKHLKARSTLSWSGCGHRLGRSHAFCPGCGSIVGQAQAQQLEHRRQRVLPLDDETLELLKQYIQRGGPVIKGDKKMILAIRGIRLGE